MIYGRPDPVEYADEKGPIDWETAKIHVEKKSIMNG